MCGVLDVKSVLVSSAIAANKFLRVNTRRGLSVDKMAQKWHLVEKPWNRIETIVRRGGNRNKMCVESWRHSGAEARLAK